MSSKRRLQDHRLDTSNPADAITSVVTTFKQRDQWSRKIARDPRVKLTHRHVLRSLALCARTDSGGRLVINPTYEELADACACSRSTAIRAIGVAEKIGVARKARKSDGRVSNAFELLLPEAGSNGVKFSAPTVSNSDADDGPNGVKFAAPTVSNSPDDVGSNGVTADTVLRLRERKEVSKKESKRGDSPALTTINDRPIPEPRAREPLAPIPRAVDAAPNPAFDTVDDAPISTPERPVPRADARTEPVAARNQPPPFSASKNIGRPAMNGADADAERAAVFDHGRKVLGTGCDALIARLLDAECALEAFGAAKRVHDALDIAANEDDPHAHIENEIAVTLHVQATHQ